MSVLISEHSAMDAKKDKKMETLLKEREKEKEKIQDDLKKIEEEKSKFITQMNEMKEKEAAQLKELEALKTQIVEVKQHAKLAVKEAFTAAGKLPPGTLSKQTGKRERTTSIEGKRERVNSVDSLEGQPLQEAIGSFFFFFEIFTNLKIALPSLAETQHEGQSIPNRIVYIGKNLKSGKVNF